MADALEQLLNKKPLEKITVSDITDKCSINRQTFYYHFRDIYDLTRWMISGYAEKDIGENIENNDWHEAFLASAYFLKKKKNAFLGIVSSVGHFFVTNFLVDVIRPYIKEVIYDKAEGTGCAERYTEFLSDYYTVAFSGILLGWIITDNDTSTSPEELLELLEVTINGSIEPAIERYIAKYDYKA